MPEPTLWQKIMMAQPPQQVIQQQPGRAYQLYVQQTKAENPQAPVMTPEEFFAQQQQGQQVPNASQLPIK